ncbi:5-oxoprolinase subunit PxpA [Megasphaera cerevisiae]|jgi:UPF0271 protein|uniref:5-oxoprolinase subunit PxpA n=1 Tax=Megasphaera cerevisiae TaxID=39029 RepID=UPI0009458710|nr:5-oxoprolinase subunit PxpA [Megasphaera cerevisiae]OKY53572.1 lactam utilization protein LamB [Megasphaera cerevisiae]
MLKVDLNSDLGESYGRYTLGCDEELLKTISSANVACGFHAGDPTVMDYTVQLAKKYHTALGAHPGFPDRQGFGRRPMLMKKGELKNLILYQLGALQAFAAAYGVQLEHVKPHGALNNMMVHNEMYSEEICDAILAIDPQLILVAPTNTLTYDMGKAKGLRTISEVFADRRYDDDGYILSRSQPQAMIEDIDTAIAQVIHMVKYGKVTTIHGKEVNIKAESICVHGDGPIARAYAHTIRNALEAAQIKICNMNTYLG